ncbi:box C/D snoRNA protein 1 [Drosophila innubila]|uniref:box C/D snoRNA protein 1 n=1 Tax=Drosophila innubila TaxID=198719 RepID=UPI00148C0DCF|nr:box C/D snoRNA protein 1 [Drosophila innubila]
MSDINIENPSDSNKRMRLGVCEVCGGKEAIYACPKCEVKTCALACVQIHKRELNCDGIRDRTKYMPLSAMTEREFLSDYCFLEECTRYAESRKRDQSKRYTQQQRQLPVPLYRMRQEAFKRNIRLQFLLPHFTRHKQNTTYLNWKLQRFFWHIEWLFTHVDNATTTATTTRFVDTRCNEQETLSTLLNKYLDLQLETALQQRKVLQQHQRAGIGQLTLWLRAEGVRRSGSRCYALKAHKSLRENLAGKTIIEFPTIYVSYEQRPPTGYDVIDSDEETDDVADVTAATAIAAVSKSEQKQQPAAKKSKSTTAKSKELPVLHNLYDLAASFGAAEDEEEEDDDDNDDNDDEDDEDESEANSDELPSESEEPLNTCTY